MKFRNLERLLPMGYIFLVALGIAKDSVFYYLIGINFLQYSNISDVLMSPIALITGTPIVLIVFLIYMILAYFGYRYLAKKPHHTLAKAFLRLDKLPKGYTEEDVKIRAGNRFIQFFIYGAILFFLGIGTGSGIAISDRIKNNDIQHKTSLNFSTGENKQVYLIGSNSGYYFFIEKENPNIQISPTVAVKTIEFLKE